MKYFKIVIIKVIVLQADHTFDKQKKTADEGSAAL